MRRALGSVIALGLVAGLLMPAAALAAYLNMRTARREIRRTVQAPGVYGVQVRACHRMSKSKVRCSVTLRRSNMVCAGRGEASRPTPYDLYGHAWGILCRSAKHRRHR